MRAYRDLHGVEKRDRAFGGQGLAVAPVLVLAEVDAVVVPDVGDAEGEEPVEQGDGEGG